ncbi:hypothetical protein BU204_24835 [Actinophytocola xanthii]|uniref:Hemerythrin-like domain-containing protein n=1 Tax=Actinophytocola xanthii TaxID=1912961 RepID=A0A1Q8CKI0_9PSEU|nr:hypothetical protein BU204_24835 [Actinophytocola xanthii]
MLTDQHRAIAALFDEVERGDGTVRREAFERLVRLLAVHETAEEQLVHPLARVTLRSGRAVIDERLAEEHTAKRTLAALEKLGPASPEFSAVLARLRDEVLEHARNEETHEFARLREQVPAVELRALVPLVRAAEAAAPTHPHAGVESATRNALVGPLLSLFDRTKDLAGKAIGKESRT